MAQSADLPAAVLSEIRIGSVAEIGHSGIRSAIGKRPLDAPVRIELNGPLGDQHAERFHGGPEKAILHYDSAHYAVWQAEFADVASAFQPGGFGENFVGTGLSEATVCVGDYLRVGSALLQVSESRQPCFKLNHRFGHLGVSRRSQESGRTGWFYRVLEPGEVAAGDTIAVVDRPLPEWPIARLQHYLYHLTDDFDMARVLSELPHLSPGFRALFAKRVASGQVENWESRLSNGPLVSGPPA
ncbi:MOSC domain-containing protein [Pleomorphomonas sp. PLEO]|uniref:MOSC domain-containing protein n=1 Tax=Pleomorphomonas sp. PLEO TaxID=3239306 RepID=UPI00351DE960